MPFAVGAALVVAHDSDRLEADLGVGGGCAVVVRGRIDREAVVAFFGDEPVDEGPDRLGADSPVLVLRREGDSPGFCDVQAGEGRAASRARSSRHWPSTRA